MEGFIRHIKEGTTNLVRNKWLTVISLLSVMVTLFIVGVFSLLIFNVNHITKNIEDDVEAVVYLNLDITKEEKADLEKAFNEINYVKEVRYVDKKDGLQNLISDLGEYGAAFESLKEDNPLNDTFVLKPNNPDDIEKLSKELESLKGIERVDYGKDVVDVLFKITNTVRTIGLLLIIGLIITALLLISNTIKTSIDVRREEIKIMRLVGASNGYIRSPFIVEGLLIGLIGALVPLIVIFLGYSYIFNYYNELNTVEFMNILSAGQVIPIVVLIVLGTSLLIGGIGSFLSIRKHLKV